MPIVTPARRRPLVPSLLIIATTLILAGSVIAAASPAAASRSMAPPHPAHDGFAGSSGDARLGDGLSVPLAVGPTTPGLDVSHWQGVIDWSQVASAGYRFVFVKATDGNGTVDPMFATNRDGALANGVLVGAYHFARPDLSPGDAQREARFFLNQANPTAGGLVPVLDIEVNDGLDQTQMTLWATRWVNEVRTITGVTPLVYTSPHGWLDRFGDSTDLAADGARLWVAHWGVPSPTVPASDWNGLGWVVWQYTDAGRVPGIGGNVDLDKLAGLALSPLIIRHLSLSVDGDAGTVSSSPAALDCRAICERNVDPNTTITLTATPDTSAYFTGWGGDCAAAGTAPTCTIAMSRDRTGTARFVTDITPPVPALTPPTSFVGPAVVSFDEPTRGLTPFNVVLRDQAGGGDLPVTRVCHSSSGIVPCTSLNVQSITLVPVQPWIPGRNYTALIDPPGTGLGVRDKIGNITPATPLNFEGLTAIQDTAEPVTYTWGTAASPAAYGGSFAMARQPGAAFRFVFTGPSVTWYTVMGPAFGKAEVLIDGQDRGVVDLWATHRISKVAHTISGLRRGSHVITIRVLGLKRPASLDRLVAVDAFRGGGSLVPTPRGSQSWREVLTPGASSAGFAAGDVAGAAVTFRFDGTGVDWTAVTGSDRGRASIYVDGVLIRTLDLYSAARTFGVVESVSGLSDGPHILRIVADGRRQPASTGTLVTVDRFDVG